MKEYAEISSQKKSMNKKAEKNKKFVNFLISTLKNIVYWVMKNTETTLSLSQWPTQSIASPDYKLSPISQKVVLSAKINFLTLLPISKQEFILQNNLSSITTQEIHQKYESHIQRIKTQVQILKSLWVKAEKGEDRKNLPNKCRSVSNNKMIQSFKIHGRSESILISSKKKNMVKSKRSEAKKKSAYSDYYGKIQTTIKKKKSDFDQETTKSRKKGSENQKTPLNTDYFSCTPNPKKKQQKQKSQKSNPVFCGFFEILDQTIRQWVQIDKNHEKQISILGELSQRQKKRLKKIHQVEKEKLRNKIQAIQNDLTLMK